VLDSNIVVAFEIQTKVSEICGILKGAHYTPQRRLGGEEV
jgi:hypothetical protein